jgi:hypothetical protein
MGVPDRVKSMHRRTVRVSEDMADGFLMARKEGDSR